VGELSPSRSSAWMTRGSKVAQSKRQVKMMVREKKDHLRVVLEVKRKELEGELPEAHVLLSKPKRGQTKNNIFSGLSWLGI